MVISYYIQITHSKAGLESILSFGDHSYSDEIYSSFKGVRIPRHQIRDKYLSEKQGRLLPPNLSIIKGGVVCE